MTKSKHRKKVYLVIVALFKGVALYAALLLLLLILNNSNRLFQTFKQYEQFHSLDGYYGIRISPEIDVSESGLQKLDETLVRFFKATNGVNSRLLSVGTQISLYDNGLISFEEMDIKDFIITVNETYLRECPIYDLNGNEVRITENLDQDYLLIPEKYRSMSEELKTYHEKNNTFLRYFIEDSKKMGMEAAHNQVHEIIPLNLIYVKDEQFIEVYNMNVRGKFNALVKNPLVKIVTNNNVSDAQIPHYITHQDYLIKITDDNRNSIYHALKESGLEDFVMEIYSVWEEYRRNIIQNIGILFIQLSLICIIGYSTCKTEMRYLKDVSPDMLINIFVFSWIIVICLAMYMNISLSMIRIIGILIMSCLDIIIYKMCIKPR